MTNQLVGDVYVKIIEEVVAASKNDFEESGVSRTTLQELQQEWQAKLSARGVATMPWDPKPAPPAAAQVPTPAPTLTPNAANGYAYDPQSNSINHGPQIKQEPGAEMQYSGLANGYAPGPAPAQGGYARAQQLVQQYSGQNTGFQGGQGQHPPPQQQQQQQQQQQRAGLALPGQQGRPQGLQLPGSSGPQQPMPQRSTTGMTQADVKLEATSPRLAQIPQQQPSAQPTPTFSQTDGAGDDLSRWQSLLAERRALHAQATQMMQQNTVRSQVLRNQNALESGLMMPLDERRNNTTSASASGMEVVVPQLDGDVDDDKADSKDEDDENAINSDLDDSDDDAQNQMGDDDDDNGDSILCTYDKVQRVKNKWKCTLKDGIMSVGGREYVFHKGTGEFEW